MWGVGESVRVPVGLVIESPEEGEERGVYCVK